MPPPPGSRSTCIRTCCGTRSPRMCCSPRATCARCRRCWATRASPRPRSIRTSTSSISPRSTTRPIRAPGAARVSALAAPGVTPVTVLTGFLGSGKTTLLERLLREPRWRDSAVIVNEWGEVGLDHALVREASDNVVLLPSGCLCCRVAGDLVRTLRELHVARHEGRVPPFRRVVVETSGLANPGPILATLIEMPVVAARYALAGIVTTVDAEHGEQQLEQHGEARRQVAL